MTKRLTQEEFLTKALLIHGSNYGYELVEYITGTVKVNIKCIKHDLIFSQTPAAHLTGQGCPKCGKEKAHKANTMTKCVFKEKATMVHGNKYVYNDEELLGNKNKIEIFCKEHNLYFKQSPNSHLRGSGCYLCGKTKFRIKTMKGVESFIEKSNKTHNFKYLYDEVIYVNNTTKVKIFCKEHEKYFFQSPMHHMAGSGCPSCTKGGFSTLEAGKFYIFVCGDTTKIGITNRGLSARLKAISKSFGAEFTICKVYEFEDGVLINDLETNILKILCSKYLQPKAKFQGSSECFLNVDYQDLLLIIEQELSKLQ